MFIHSKFVRMRLVFCILMCVCLAATVAIAQESNDDNPLDGSAVAPANTVRVGRTLGGAYFVDKDLYNKYQTLKDRLEKVRREIASGSATGASALATLAAIDRESQKLRDEIEKSKILVSAFQVFSQTSEDTFPLGDEQLVIITGDNVNVRGWEGPGIKCVIEKTIIAKEEPDPSEFDDIRVEHKLEIAKEKVGLTREERDKGEEEFLDSEAGRKLTPEQRLARQIFVDEIHHSFDDYLAFQGRAANTLQLKGLSYDDGNQNLTVRINSPDGGGSVSGQWQRHAKMTIYVPPCKSLAVRGCLQGLDIQGIECDLVLTTHDSRDRDYEGSFTVQEVKGNVNVSQVPVRHLSDVEGNVRFAATEEFVNSGTHHEGGTRTFSAYETKTTRIHRIKGNVVAEFLRTNLELASIDGTLDVINRFGSTHFDASSIDATRIHRIISDSGEISVTGAQQQLTKTPIYAHTECGELHTNFGREVLDDFSFSTGHPRRGWHGMVTPSNDRFSLGRFQRPADALENKDRSAGLDLISLAGRVSVVSIDADE